jgi:2-(1,2-epoxy-1,2-dihydrophenyl)acetyl-CoA isomerase
VSETGAYTFVSVGVELGVGTLTLNRPDSLNAFTAEMVDEAVSALATLVHHAEVRAILITGAGKGFCAGADMDELRQAVEKADADLGRRLVDGPRAVGSLIRSAPQPVIAAINGVAAGGGANLALACDLRIAADTARIGQVYTKFGLHPDWGGTYHLTRLVGPSKAMELFLSGDLIDAQEAMRIGMVNKVVESHHLADVARSWARHVAAGPPLAVRALKHAVYLSERATLERMLDFELESQLACFQSEDAREGLEAHFAKRTPHFHGR